jgi:hypothetical protein
MSWLKYVSFRCSKMYIIWFVVEPDPSPDPSATALTANLCWPFSSSIQLYRSPSNVLIIHNGDVINRVRLLLNRLLRCPKNGRRPFATDSSLTHPGCAYSIILSLTVARLSTSSQPLNPELTLA